MNYAFNNNLESLYAIDYGANRSKNIIKQTENAAEQDFFDDLYRTYLSRVNDQLRDDVLLMGDYHQLANYVLDGQKPLPDLSVFQDLFLKYSPLQGQIIDSVKNSDTINRLNLDLFKEFIGIDSASDINILLTMFINGGFGVFNGNSNIIVGVKYDPASAQYGISTDIYKDIYRDLAYPYVQMLTSRENLILPTNSAPVSVDYLNELLARAVEIIFLSKIYGEDYIESALTEQDKMNLAKTRIFLSLYLENKDKVTNLQDFTDLLLSNELLAKA